MKVLVAYATSEGQTRKIARQIADRIADANQTVELLELSDANDIDLARFDGAILAASLHVGHYQRSLTDFAVKQSKNLQKKPTLFLSISLAAAGHEADDWKGLDHILKDFVDATGWNPGRVEQVAGAYLPSKYDIFRRFIMRRIIASKHLETDLDADQEYTDWSALNLIVDDWLDTLDI